MILATTKVADKWQGYLLATIMSTGLRCATLLALARKPHSCGSFGTRWLPSMSGGHVLPWCSSPNFFFGFFFGLPNTTGSIKISFGIAFKLGELGGGLHSLCTNYVGWELATTTTLTRKKPSLGKGFLRSLSRKLRSGTFFMASPFGQFGLSAMIECSIMNKWHKSTIKHFIWEKAAWARVIKFDKINATRPNPSSKVSTNCGGLRTCFVGGTIYTLLGVGKNGIARLICSY